MASMEPGTLSQFQWRIQRTSTENSPSPTFIRR
ncbi:hypothetical protein Gohar_009869 [Gossypium harknessii]|uniref:Uncharacterized protein n=1 Tax=Gossypium harknessii TaxID=34285 RepID=A0A7J9GPT5_9ROSI|nr:hypothetical protein [Gossypium harknessii]